MTATLEPVSQETAGAINKMFSAAGVPGASVAIYDDGRFYQHSYGVRRSNSSEPVTARTAFNIGSCSKAFTATVMASLIGDGLADWDDPIARYVPEFKLYDEWITEHASLRDLSGNRLGLSRHGLTEFGFEPNVSCLEIFDGLRFTQPAFPFRGRFTYVNPGHTAVAVAAGRIAGSSFLEALKTRLLVPLGMLNSSGGASAKHELSEFAGWHCLTEGGAISIDPIFSDSYFGAGGIVVSGADATKWLEFLLCDGMSDGQQIMAPSTLKATFAPQCLLRPGIDSPALVLPTAKFGAYGLGWGISEIDGHMILTHAGADLGIAAMTILVPELRFGIAVYANARTSAAIEVAFTAVEAKLGLNSRDWARLLKVSPQQIAPAVVTSPAQCDDSKRFGKFVGEYFHPADGVLEIRQQGSSLYGELRRGYKMEFALDSLGSGKFSVEFKSPEWCGEAQAVKPWIEFKTDEAGMRWLSFVGTVSPMARDFVAMADQNVSKERSR